MPPLFFYNLYGRNNIEPWCHYAHNDEDGIRTHTCHHPSPTNPVSTLIHPSIHPPPIQPPPSTHSLSTCTLSTQPKHPPTSYSPPFHSLYKIVEFSCSSSVHPSSSFFMPTEEYVQRIFACLANDSVVVIS